MNDFFTELKKFVEDRRNSDIDGVYLIYGNSRIYMDLALEIYRAYFPLLEDYQAGNELRDEQRDFIRLLREENARLRGLNDE